VTSPLLSMRQKPMAVPVRTGFARASCSKVATALGGVGGTSWGGLFSAGVV